GSRELPEPKLDVFFRIETEEMLGEKISSNSIAKLDGIGSLKSNEPLRCFYRAVIFASIGQFDKAYENNARFLKANPSSSIPYHQRVNLFLIQNNKEKALSFLSQSITGMSKHVFLYKIRADLLFSEFNDYKKSEADLLTARRLSSDYQTLLWLMEFYASCPDPKIGAQRKLL